MSFLRLDSGMLCLSSGGVIKLYHAHQTDVPRKVQSVILLTSILPGMSLTSAAGSMFVD
jgi:hypothetical protein